MPTGRIRVVTALVGSIVLVTVGVVVIRWKVIEAFQDFGAALFVQYLKEDFMPKERQTSGRWPASLAGVGQDLAIRARDRDDERSRALLDTFRESSPELAVTRRDNRSLDGIVTFHWRSGRVNKIALHTRADFYQP